MKSNREKSNVWFHVFTLVILILVFMPHLLAQDVKLEIRSLETTEKGILVKGTVNAGNLNPEGQVCENDGATVLADIVIGPNPTYPELPDWHRIRPYGMMKGDKALTKEELAGTDIKTVIVSQVGIRGGTVWYDYGGVNTWRDKAPASVKQDFEGLIPLEYAGKKVRIRVQLRHQFGGPHTSWSAITFFHDIAFEGILEAAEKENQPPTVSLSYSPTQPQEGDTVTIKAVASDPDGDPLTYTWFVNGVKKAGQDKTLVLPNLGSGTFTVEVLVSDGKDSATDKIKFTVEKKNQPPTVSPDYTPKDLVEGDSVTMTANASDPDNDPLEIQWHDENGNLVHTGESFSLSNLSPGTYTYSVTASDGRGGTDTKSLTFTVKPKPVQPNRKPELTVDYAPKDLVEGDSVTITASATDPDGDRVVVTFIVDGRKIEGAGSHRIDNLKPGTYKVTVQADDGKPGAPTQKSVTITVKPKPKINRPPTLSPDVWPRDPKPGDTVIIRANGSDPDGDPLEYTFTYEGKTERNNNGIFEIPNVVSGRHTVVITVSDAHNPPVSQTIVIVVCGCQDWTCTNFFISDRSPDPGDVIRISGDIHNPCPGGVECEVFLLVDNEKCKSETLFIPGTQTKDVSFDIGIPLKWQGQSKILSLFLESQGALPGCGGTITIPAEPPAWIKGTVLEVTILEAIESATVKAVPKRFIDPDLPPLLSPAVFTGRVGRDGHYTVKIDLSQLSRSVYDPCEDDVQDLTPQLIREVEFDVSVDERPRYLGPSFGMMDCGKNITVKSGQTISQIDFRLVPQMSKDPSLVYSFTQKRNLEKSEEGGPLNQLVLNPGSYTVSVGGGKNTYVTLTYSVVGDPAQAGVRQSVTASLDYNCMKKDAVLTVGTGQRIENITFQIYSIWMPCQGVDPVNSIGFVIKR